VSSLNYSLTGRHQEEPEGSQKRVEHLVHHVGRKVVGQHALIEGILVCLFAGGHVLIEGMPGLAKTTVAHTIADGLESEFHRIQFTPDLLPSDIVGTEIYSYETGKFSFRQGPVFNNIVLADEINRAPAKVQSALLEAMEEKQVTVGCKSYLLPDFFMVIATQNPVEQEGTYNLPEAQLDRFLMNIVVDYPSREEELLILNMEESGFKSSNRGNTDPVFTQQDIFHARSEIAKVFVSDSIKDYIVSLVRATRCSSKYDADHLGRWIVHGVSPRATLAVLRCAKAFAWLRQEEFVTPLHVQAVMPNIFRHRLMLSFEAEADGVSREQVVSRILQVVALP
jgi:MoxR-like ATPase